MVTCKRCRMRSRRSKVSIWKVTSAGQWNPWSRYCKSGPYHSRLGGSLLRLEEYGFGLEAAGACLVRSGELSSSELVPGYIAVISVDSERASRRKLDTLVETLSFMGK